jgi:hypothetical protein
MNTHSADTRSSRSSFVAHRVELAAIAALAAFAVSSVSAQQSQQQQQQQQPAAQGQNAQGQSQPAYLAGQLEEVTAQVAAIDPEKRLVTLKLNDGTEFTVKAGEDVQNFSQIKVGDEVNVKYYQSLAADLTNAPASNDTGAVVLAERAAPGQEPGGGAGVIYTAEVTIDSINPQTNTVTFTGPEGQERQVMVESDQGKAFLKNLKAGDRVQLTYTEAVAIAVAPAGSSRSLQ